MAGSDSKALVMMSQSAERIRSLGGLGLFIRPTPSLYI